MPGAVGEALEALRQAGVGGPYAIALGPTAFAALTRTVGDGGYPVMKHVQQLIDRPVVWAPSLAGGIAVSLRGGDFKLICGRDAAIGYLSHDEKQVRLYLEESFSAELIGPEAAVPLVLPEDSKRATRGRAGREDEESIMKFEIPPLPYPKNALAPFIGAETVDLHYEKHHKGYLEKLEKLVRGKPEADESLEDLIRTARGDVFNNAAQVWNHNFYWLSMQPERRRRAGGRARDADREVVRVLHRVPRAVRRGGGRRIRVGLGVARAGLSGRLLVCNSDDAENPLQRDLVPLLTLDVWEHAYYLDYRNERARYVENSSITCSTGTSSPPT